MARTRITTFAGTSHRYHWRPGPVGPPSRPRLESGIRSRVFAHSPLCFRLNAQFAGRRLALALCPDVCGVRRRPRAARRHERDRQAAHSRNRGRVRWSSERCQLTKLYWRCSNRRGRQRREGLPTVGERRLRSFLRCGRSPARGRSGERPKISGACFTVPRPGSSAKRRALFQSWLGK